MRVFYLGKLFIIKAWYMANVVRQTGKVLMTSFCGRWLPVLSFTPDWLRLRLWSTRGYQVKREAPRWLKECGRCAWKRSVNVGTNALRRTNRRTDNVPSYGETTKVLFLLCFLPLKLKLFRKQEKIGFVPRLLATLALFLQSISRYLA